MKRVAIQGGLGAYHEIAARNYFSNEDVTIVPCITFRDIFEETKKDPNLIGIMAIENTIAGGLLPNHDLLKLNDLWIVGEYKLRISHNLAALPDQSIEDIKEVTSHPMALMQCDDFLDSMPRVKVVEHEDTALAAKEIYENNLKGVAAICSSHAAELYNLNVLAAGIETNKRNFTRFLILAHKEMLADLQKDNNINKSSLVFVLPHSEGSLSRILSVLSFYGINLTRIQSLPIIGREWEYQFYIDLTFSDYNRYKQSIEAIMPLVANLKVLGEYKQGKNIDIENNEI
ncbi:MAG: prephenate dehydratase [Dysgonamonadaceae bacterium]|nr:prephenate dehydratase [Dysgonamonadaceae bacterium]MDD4728723.1 prephenate dehydratase [Dysgonamonadaceae bacterium]